AAQTALALANAEQYAEAEQTIKALAMIETLQPADVTRPDADIDRRILQGFVDLSQADLATLRTLQSDGCYQVAAAGGRAWPRNVSEAARKRSPSWSGRAASSCRSPPMSCARRSPSSAAMPRCSKRDHSARCRRRRSRR